MARVNRTYFKYTDDFIVVRPIRLTKKDFLQPGDEIDKTKFRRHHLKSLYLRRRIGVIDSPWAEAMLANLKDAHARPEAVVKELPVEEEQDNGDSEKEETVTEETVTEEETEEESETEEETEEDSTEEEETESVSETEESVDIEETEEEPLDLNDYVHKKGRRWYVDHPDDDGVTHKTKKAAKAKAEELLSK